MTAGKPTTRWSVPGPQTFGLDPIISSSVVFNACVMDPSNPNYNLGAGYNQPSYGAAPVDVSDLNNGNAQYATQ